MSEKVFDKEIIEKADKPSTVDNVTHEDEESEPLVFYRCVCPECGANALKVFDSGVFTQSPVLGITNDGEIGCSHTELGGGYDLAVYCRSCGHHICKDSFTNVCTEDLLFEWAESHGEARNVLAFGCPKCDSHELVKVEIGVELSSEVVAVCESDSPDAPPIVAVSHIRDIDRGGSYKYRCSRGHELAKDDGGPVQTPEELVEWLKANVSGRNG
jgi:hypothetical protein